MFDVVHPTNIATAPVLTHRFAVLVKLSPMADITMLLVSREGLGVPTHSILNRRNGTMVYLPNDGKAVPCLVKCGLENDGMTEVTGEGLSEGTAIISEGQYMLSDNDAIRIQE